MSETGSGEPPSLTPEVAAKVHEALEVWEAWQQREFSAATIAADPWTAVYLPLPENADASLLAAAQVAAVTCVGMIELGEQWHGPRVPQVGGPAEYQAKALLRLDELEARRAGLPANKNSPERIALASSTETVQASEQRAPLTAAAIAEDPVNAVHLEIPEGADCELLTLIATTAGAVAFTVREAHRAAVNGEAVNLDNVPEHLRRYAEELAEFLTGNEMWALGHKAAARQQEAGERAIELEEGGTKPAELGSPEPDAAVLAALDAVFAFDAKTQEVDAAPASVDQNVRENNPGYSRWTGEPLGETTSVTQSAGKGQLQ
jgi:hypothetical protein